MHDSEFEKQVQQKMQELKFAPGADVWARVQADIQKKKRRRPVVFWFLLAGLMIGGSMIYYTGVLNSSKQNVHAGTTSTEKKNESKNESKNGTKNESITTQQTSETKQPSSTQQPSLAIDQPEQAKNNITENNIEKNNSTSIAPRRIVQKNIRKTSNPAPELIEKPTDNKPVQTSETNAPVNDLTTTTKEEPQETTVAAKIDSTTNKKEEEVTATKKEDNTAIKKEEEPGVAMNNKKQKTSSAKKSNWQFGITAGAGISDLGRQLFKPTTVADFALGNAAANPNPNAFNRRPSQVTAGNAFHAGAYVSRDLGKKFAVKLGLNYEYYSNNIKVGTQVDSTRFVNQGTDMKMVEQYYTSGNLVNYDNKYHFVSVPLTVQWKAFDRKKYGIVWENGVSLSRLMKTTALHFDGISGTYYKDDELFRKTQLMVSSSVLFTLKSKNNVQLYAGPHVQYGISNLLIKDAGQDKHLRYAGLKLMVGFNKK